MYLLNTLLAYLCCASSRSTDHFHYVFDTRPDIYHRSPTHRFFVFVSSNLKHFVSYRIDFLNTVTWSSDEIINPHAFISMTKWMDLWSDRYDAIVRRNFIFITLSEYKFYMGIEHVNAHPMRLCVSDEETFRKK